MVGNSSVINYLVRTVVSAYRVASAPYIYVQCVGTIRYRDGDAVTYPDGDAVNYRDWLMWPNRLGGIGGRLGRK